VVEGTGEDLNCLNWDLDGFMRFRVSLEALFLLLTDLHCYYESSVAQFTLSGANVHFVHRSVVLIIKVKTSLTGFKYSLQCNYFLTT
jgi:hypothetical protein